MASVPFYARCEEPINPSKRTERECGDEARTYCADCQRAVCDIHRASRHEGHHIEERS